MNGLIKASLKNPIAVTCFRWRSWCWAAGCCVNPVDILPVFRSPAVQTLVFYGGMPAANIEKNITATAGARWTRRRAAGGSSRAPSSV